MEKDGLAGDAEPSFCPYGLVSTCVNTRDFGKRVCPGRKQKTPWQRARPLTGRINHFALRENIFLCPVTSASIFTSQCWLLLGKMCRNI